MLQSIIEAFEGEDIVALCGLDDAIMGFDEKDRRLVYSVTKILGILQSQGMTEDEALEYYEYNILCLHIGDRTPILCNDTFEQ